MTTHKPRNVVISLDPRGVITAGGADVFERQNIYGQALFLQDQKLSFKIMTTFTRSGFAKAYEYVSIYSISQKTFNFYMFTKKTHKLIRNQNWQVKLILCDAWESFFCAYLLNFFLRKKVPIQFQIHGDIAATAWQKLNYKNKIRFLIAKITIPQATSIRVVTKYQSKNISNVFRVSKKDFFIVPVPVVFSESKSFANYKKGRTVGFIGRIHQDRGIWEFIELIKKLNMQTQDFKLIIAGDGPDKEKFLSRLYEILPKSRITYLGHIPEKDLRKVWRRVGVLVSLAPVESYGRVMREALVAGVPVWARSSSGVRDLMDKCEKGTVKIIDLNKSVSELSKDFEVLLKTKVGPKFAKKFIKENDTYAEKLAQSWIKTINKSKKA